MAKHESNTPSRRGDDQQEGIGGIVDEIASSWIVGDALTRLVDTGERVVRAQQSAFSALGLPSGSQFESLTLRVRTLFHRIEELEDDLDRLDSRISALERGVAHDSPARPAVKQKPAVRPKPAVKAKPAAKAKPAVKPKPKPAAKPRAAAKKPAARPEPRN
jgi:hypothetical protein